MTLLCVLAAACSRPDDTATLTPAGVTLRGVIDLRIGAIDVTGSDTLLFEDISGLTFDSAGNIFVSDAGANRIFRFSPLGALEAYAGQQGQGPGDLDRPCCIAFDSAGFLWVEEEGNRRYSEFRAGDGQLAFTRSLPMPVQPSGRRDRIAWAPQGELVHVSLVVSPTPPQFRIVRVFLDKNEKVSFSDTLPEPPMDSLRSATITTQRGGSSGLTEVAQPFGPRSLHAIGPDGSTASAVSSRYAVTIRNPNRGLSALVDQAMVGPDVSEPERRAASRMLAELTQRLGVPRSAVPFGVPDRKAPLQQLGFDLTGRLWVQRSVALHAPNIADIYTMGGESVGTAEWPASVRLVGWAIRGNTGLGVEADSLGRQQVVRLQFN
ncbi:MAG: hypothetical protein R2910_13210 [Gemmatimonadales bacterium]